MQYVVAEAYFDPVSFATKNEELDKDMVPKWEEWEGYFPAA